MILKVKIYDIKHKSYGVKHINTHKCFYGKIDLKCNKITSKILKNYSYTELIKTKDDNNKIYYKVTNCPIYENKAITINYYNKIKLWYFNFKMKNVFIALYNLFKHSLN